ncbi:MAG: ATP-dependent DNA helicase RecG [Candidatus Nitrohelix vancouverensis]|uniref:ATP-dependent DNA helicase RecG n=1 Tax=Candidatus Nitrohelix vancouverensis TaxID=2705534 RepID=A0A7T0G4F6_9BACT|nr:MAG: ATP-dependent DNA helicase RecG [Candidatus Nitrohelix vancouverensis]
MPKENKTPSLEDSLQFVKGVGPKRVLLLKKLGLETIDDALHFLPFRYEDRSQVKTISQLNVGEAVTLAGSITSAGSMRAGHRKKIFEVIVQDETGFVSAKWFQFNEKYMTGKFEVGNAIVLSGTPVNSRYSGSGIEFVHPDVETSSSDKDALEMGQILPVYRTTEGLPVKSMRAIMRQVVEHYADRVEEFLPAHILQANHFPKRSQAFRDAHLPPKGSDIKALESFQSPAQARLIYEELFLIQLGLASRKKLRSFRQTGNPLKTRGELVKDLVKQLPFELTNAQKRVLKEIMEDLEQPHPMNRLLQGDVGSGKTVVALTSLLTAVDNGMQAALMAPTELLCEQHYASLSPYCERLGISIALLTGAGKAKDRARIQENISQGNTQLIVGTHALIQKGVDFNNLGLIVVDEQHRFGVLQREAIGKKGKAPHALIMTATPIPRSLSLTLYGDLSVSYLDESPPGRQPIQTRIFYDKKRMQAYELLSKEIAKGRQAYIVCPLIEESEKMELKAATETLEFIKTTFPDLKAELIHGRMKREERQDVMARFLEGSIQILVATTVIEVGIDVPNASLMIVEHAERFGLSQLHQLRGRVGRGRHLSHCMLIAYFPLSEEGKLRLEAMKNFTDGFAIAEEDLKIRGPGDFMGTRQSGIPLLRVANLLRDFKWLTLAREEATRLIEADPQLQESKHIKLKQALQNTMGDKLDLMAII